MSGMSVERALRRHKTEDVAKAAFSNEELTRERVERLERRAARLEDWTGGTERLLARGFFGRLRWLLFGSRPEWRKEA